MAKRYERHICTESGLFSFFRARWGNSLPKRASGSKRKFDAFLMMLLEGRAIIRKKPPLGRLCVAHGVFAKAYGFALQHGDPGGVAGDQQRGAEDIVLVLIVDVPDHTGQLHQIGGDLGAGVFQIEGVHPFALCHCPGYLQRSGWILAV